MSIYNDFVRVNFPDVEGDDLLRLSGRAECAADSILNGVAAIGKMMFYAGDIDNSVYEPDAADFRDIGGMLMELMPLARALTDTAANAECQHRQMAKRK
ncbi:MULTISPECIES: ubiquinol-cytochrome C reductase [Enterobacter cloacae complex]|uniref:ubiquinol-cytochrome C reductase n=1 Tax=Enterobacter cloacae complex TaxID=354276 RepID=UPI000F66A7EF|nr:MULTISPECIES: ubiquinol-cytochrome C reductase [Enterobacter cloacae complex]RSA29819.1 ubiquinol-cytochrome C reductase [Enterobacter hormaechei]UZQ70239.1 ubiquinol-cytochrome C reductase [Enterobacter kobei]UZQ70252.1 ubiquinol-cytochrome C reductase [Enterobacter kobei]UZQ70268.1 ubiquinol-cytochrome C reductase [Enterobacter kobei]